MLYACPEDDNYPVGLGRVNARIRDLARELYESPLDIDPGYKFPGDARPAFMLLVIRQRIWPEILLEVEVITAKAV